MFLRLQIAVWDFVFRQTCLANQNIRGGQMLQCHIICSCIIRNSSAKFWHDKNNNITCFYALLVFLWHFFMWIAASGYMAPILAEFLLIFMHLIQKGIVWIRLNNNSNSLIFIIQCLYLATVSRGYINNISFSLVNHEYVHNALTDPNTFGNSSLSGKQI